MTQLWRAIEDISDPLALPAVWAEKCEEDGLTALAADPAMRRAGTAVAVDSPEYGAVVHVGPGVSFDPRPDVPARPRTHVADLGERLRTLVKSDDKAGRFLWKVFSDLFLYSASMVPEISDTIVDSNRPYQE